MTMCMDGVDKHMTVAEFVETTPDVPAERIACSQCDSKFIGNPNDGDVCPTCRRERGESV